MMSDIVFSKEMDRLQAAFNWKLPMPTLEVWYNALQEKAYTDSELTLGVSRAMYNNPRFPSLAELDKSCYEERLALLDIKRKQFKDDENKYKNLTQDQIFTRGKDNKNPIVRELCQNLFNKIDGLIDYETWKSNQTRLEMQIKGF